MGFLARIALLLAAATTGLGVAVGMTVLLGPTHVRCELPPLQPGVGAVGSHNCTYRSLLASGEPIWPLPLLPIVIWSLAPALSLIRVVRMLRMRSGMPLVGLALALEATAIISFVVGPMFLLYVFLPLLLLTPLAWLASLRRAWA